MKPETLREITNGNDATAVSEAIRILRQYPDERIAEIALKLIDAGIYASTSEAEDQVCELKIGARTMRVLSLLIVIGASTYKAMTKDRRK